ncbi:hypothetical protein PoB_004132600 [Plakobranchus ocellatus]|uniref:DDE-1 domain-containing protein n=1 Tax=Plakobranchus ocellatus TaxID=259542 RepID=A0AAV4B7N8_9GAST|nr:hypothetical protein PoB_004132600 [Plakobranchus ocellatus]
MGKPIHLRPSTKLVFLPSNLKAVYPFHPKLNLIVCVLSGRNEILGVSRTSSKILMNSRWEKHGNNMTLKRYEQFCTEKSVDPFATNEHIMLDFLTDMFQKGYTYSSVKYRMNHCVHN